MVLPRYGLSGRSFLAGLSSGLRTLFRLCLLLYPFRLCGWRASLPQDGKPLPVSEYVRDLYRIQSPASSRPYRSHVPPVGVRPFLCMEVRRDPFGLCCRDLSACLVGDRFCPDADRRPGAPGGPGRFASADPDGHGRRLFLSCSLRGVGKRIFPKGIRRPARRDPASRNFSRLFPDKTSPEPFIRGDARRFFS